MKIRPSTEGIGLGYTVNNLYAIEGILKLQIAFQQGKDLKEVEQEEEKQHQEEEEEEEKEDEEEEEKDWLIEKEKK